MNLISYAYHKMNLFKVIRDGYAIIVYMARLAKNQQVTMQKKLRVYFERNQSASFASQETGVNIKTACKYFNQWAEKISEVNEFDFLSRQKLYKELITLSFDNLLSHLYDTLETINLEIRKHGKKGTEIPRHLISNKLSTINLISSITERKGMLQVTPSADEHIDMEIQKRIKKYQN